MASNTKAGPSSGAAPPDQMGLEFLLSEKWKTIKAHCMKADDPKVVEAIKEGNIELQGIFEYWGERFAKLSSKQEKFKKRTKAKFREIETQMANQIRNRLRVECKALETTVMVRGIEFHQAARNEKRKENEGETRVQTVDILTKLGLKLSLAGIQVLRLPQREITLRDGNKVWTDTVRIAFPNLQEKLDLFKCLVAKGKDFKKIKVHDAIPHDLIPAKRALDDLASDYRAKFNGTKTRTVCRFGTVFLMVKKVGETTFKKVKGSEIKKELGIVEKKKGKDDSDSDSDSEVEIEEEDDYTSPLRKGVNKRMRRVK